MALTRPTALALVLLAIAGCGGGGDSEPAASSEPSAGSTAEPAPAPAVESFDYDANAPLALDVKKKTKQGGAVVEDVTYDGGGQTVSAYLVLPRGQGPFAGVLFAHWLSEEPSSNRTEFLDEAVALAGKGVVSLLPQGTFPWKEPPTGLEHDKAAVVAQTIAYRRGLDALLAQKGVDPERIGFVGHDYGAMYGTMLAAADRRPKAYVLMTPDATWSNWFLKYWLRGERVDPYKQGFEQLDPIAYLPEATPAQVFLQFSDSDKYIPGYVADEVEEAAPDPKKAGSYGGGHALDEAARKDRDAWLAEQLSL
jgi:dienelactone hydrolase